MDGPLPHVPTFNPQGGGAPTGAPPAPQQQQQAPSGGSPGKPYVDPEKQDQRNLKHEEMKRLQGVLPAAAKEGHFAVFELRGEHGKHMLNASKPTMQVLISEVEDAQTDASEYISAALDERDLTGRYLIITRDKHGKRVAEIPDWEITNGSDEFSTDMDDSHPFGLQGQHMPYQPQAGMYMPNANHQHQHYQNQYTPPINPPGYMPQHETDDEFNQADFVETTRDLLRDEYEKGNKQQSEMVSVITTMMTQQQTAQSQMQFQLQQTQMQMEERRRQDEMRQREEADRRDERYRQEREAANNSRIQLLSVIVPAALPLIQKMMDKQPDTTMPLLLKMMEGSQAKDGMKELMTLMTEGSRQTMNLYADANRSVQESSAKAMTHMMTSLLDTSAMVTKAAVEAAQSEDDGPMDKFGRMIAMAAPILKGMSSPQSIVAPRESLPRMPAPERPQQPAVRHDALSATPAPAPAPAAVAPPTKDQLVEGVMLSIHKLATGVFAPTERKPLMAWATKEMKTKIPDLYKAVVAQDTDTVYEIGGTAVTSNQALFDWLTNGGDEFLAEFLEEIRMKESNISTVDSAELTEEDIKEVNAGIMRAPLPPAQPAEEEPEDEEPAEEKPEEKSEEVKAEE